ncbi:MAG: glycoside hydrolase family 97 C-terminal domain-containing protein, partial [Prevotella sp.]|nr:glycoside hydrolase family 97 C-terminal domain-containing protein [Prevotella sp.]
ATAAMDWGGVIMNRYLSRDNKSRHSRKTTDVFEMASGVTLQSAVQCVAMQPNNLTELPAVELDFLRSLPTTWDETRYIDGYPGRYVVLARRHGDRWLVAGLNAEPEAKRLTLSLPMLAGQTVSYYTDGKDGYAQLRQLKVDKRGQAKVTMQPNGGMILDMNH